jgi:hypothetical protein
MTLKPHYAVTPLQSFLKLTYDFSGIQLQAQFGNLKWVLE